MMPDVDEEMPAQGSDHGFGALQLACSERNGNARLKRRNVAVKVATATGSGGAVVLVDDAAE
jgi:hypothetical protein